MNSSTISAIRKNGSTIVRPNRWYAAANATASENSESAYAPGTRARHWRHFPACTSQETIGTKSRASKSARHELQRERPLIHDCPVCNRSATTPVKLAQSAPSTKNTARMSQDSITSHYPHSASLPPKFVVVVPTNPVESTHHNVPGEDFSGASAAQSSFEVPQLVAPPDSPA